MVSILRKVGESTTEVGRLVTKGFSNMAMENKLVAVTQMNATADRDRNLAICISLIETAASRGAQMVFLPEAFDYIAETREQILGWSQYLDGSLISQFQHFARKYSVWLSLGGFHQKGSNSSKISNTHVILDTLGTVVGEYSKTHLYDVDLPEKGIRLVESEYCQPGRKIVPPVETPVGNVAMSICYDVRFPELSLCQRRMGADILTYPSAFTLHTGLAHWEPLLRARAVETQCYVIAAAQTGKHNAKRSSYGHAMIVNPWGSIIAQCGEGTDVALANIDLSYLHRIREEMPVMLHRRTDLYSLVSPLSTESSNSEPLFPGDDEIIPFGHVKIKGKMVFACTQLSVASVNRKCVVPGHVLILPRRPARRLSDLTPPEINDLFQLVQKVQKMVEKFYEASSSNVDIQDGKDAGQSVKHVHVHILPRRPADFRYNDQVYEYLEGHDKGNVSWRNDEDMVEECQQLRKIFCSSS